MQFIILRTCIYAMAAPNRIDRNGFSGVDRSWRFKTRFAVSQLLSGASFQIAAWFHVQWYRNCAIAAPRHAIHQLLSLAARTLIAFSISSAALASGCGWSWVVSQVIFIIIIDSRRSSSSLTDSSVSQQEPAHTDTDSILLTALLCGSCGHFFFFFLFPSTCHNRLLAGWTMRVCGCDDLMPQFFLERDIVTTSCS